MVITCRPQALRPQTAWNQKAEIPKTSPCYLTTNQSEESPWADHTSYNLSPNAVFKNTSLKAIGVFGSFEHELPISFLGTLQINPYFVANTRFQSLAFCALGTGALAP